MQTTICMTINLQLDQSDSHLSGCARNGERAERDERLPRLFLRLDRVLQHLEHALLDRRRTPRNPRRRSRERRGRPARPRRRCRRRRRCGRDIRPCGAECAAARRAGPPDRKRHRALRRSPRPTTALRSCSRALMELASSCSSLRMRLARRPAPTRSLQMTEARLKKIDAVDQDRHGVADRIRNQMMFEIDAPVGQARRSAHLAHDAARNADDGRFGRQRPRSRPNWRRCARRGRC